MEDQRMPRPVVIPVRRAIVRLAAKGCPASQIAVQLGLKPRTVQQLVRQFRQHGQKSLAPRYARGPRIPEKQKTLRQCVATLRADHPTWGTEILRIQLKEMKGRRTIPSARTLRRWLRQEGRPQPPRGRRPIAEPERARHPHDVWQMDASEEILLGNGQQVCWLRLVDEYTGTVLGTRVFSPLTLEHSPCDPGSGGTAKRL